LSVGYGALLRGNRSFRRLWLGDVVSLFGDWFNTIALYALVGELTGSPLAMGLVFVVKMLGSAVASPLAGVIADRYDRRWLMIGSDLLRFVVVLGFLGISEAGELPLLYGLIALQVMLGAVFTPARSAALPELVRPEELLTANAMMAATWSMLLALGAALGGLAVSWIGIQGVFLVDSASYLVSALCLWGVALPARGGVEVREPLLKAAWGEMALGWRYLVGQPRVGRLAMAKSFWAMGGGALVYLLTLLGPVLFPKDGALGIGVLLAARGLGTGIGPITARRWLRDRGRWPLWMGGLMVVSGCVYGSLSWMPWSLWVLVPITAAHAMSGANWVLSSVLLQEEAEARFRGRVFATEWLLLTLTNTVVTLLAALLLEYAGVSLRAVAGIFAGVIVGMGLLWWWLLRRGARAALAAAISGEV
jgi:MFS family permease